MTTSFYNGHLIAEHTLKMTSTACIYNTSTISGSFMGHKNYILSLDSDSVVVDRTDGMTVVDRTDGMTVLTVSVT